MERKKNAATAVDSITAEDVGNFPDQNVNEAISRVAGVALDRGDDGEGQGISVRGNGPEATRVEIDGMTVLNTNGALSGGASAGTGGRAADLRELPAAIIKSIDVFKGTTAAMTEGSLGGSVRIETRNASRLRQTFHSVLHRRPAEFHHRQVDAERYRLMFARSFMDNRFGVIGNVNYSKFEIDLGSSTAADVGQCRAVPQRRFRSIAGQDLYLRSEHR